ncbi:SMP-30/gluconolactonase/LRE family protein [Flavobacteriaceae bacterium F89]|uniref:SMP-30/gluconolactonase/LRE family protein n=1 Tax=Cerina litoralis TaxID=2874477 RepID=A0AAE3JSE3_9FLAO|nr:SMP-30/gluconolactonase/LRE family protein [Cerina litoralis]MCG2460487.1 SMP-30/gluconolactonase/LRE family protein [Cerina litoralis]
MKKHLCTILLGTLFLLGCKQSNKKESQIMERQSSDFSVEILDREALNLIDPKAGIQIVASGFEWTEGPLWIKEGGYLLFSDIPNNRVLKLDSNNKVSVYLEQSGLTGNNPKGKEPGSNGLLLDSNDHLVLAQHGDRRIARMEAPLDHPAPNFSTIVDNYEGKKLNSPNDAVYDKAGNLYFTDPMYGLPKGMDDPTKELNFQGVYCHLKTGVTILLDTLTRPNGIALSPDEQKLYVAVSDEKHAVWYQYNLVAPGEVNGKQLFYDVTNLIGIEGQQGLPDGMKINNNGYVFASGPGGLWIFNPEAKAIARIHTGRLTSNCAFSGDEKKLFLTADQDVLRVDLKE